jgi:hypothetical protein
MAEIDGGALSFKSVMDNDQINTAIEETLRRVQGLSDGTVAGGKKMDAAFDATADNIRNALGQIGTACEMHEKELQNLESEYQRLGQKASAAFMAGRDEEYNAITNQQTAIKGEITVRERLLQELRDHSNELEKVAQKQDENRQKTEENGNAQISMRSRIKSLREEMMLLVDQGIDEQSEAYQRLKGELGRLIDIQSDVAQQGRTLANDEQKFQGIITGLSGLAGGFSAVTGAVGLFAGENEDLNKVMTKVQSVMAITIGLQQVAQTLNKDSAFQLVTLNSLKEWWRNVVVQATVAETAETVATTANTAAQEANAAATAANTASEVTNTVATGAQATAATAGTVANIGLAGAFRLVGVAIKSIPVFGWILAGISALIGLYAYFSSKASEAKKAQEEFSKAMIDGCYKPIGTVQSLSEKYTELGDNLEAKKIFIEQNKKAFDELGVSVNDVADAEKLFNNGAQAFIDAQIAKAKATVYMQQSMEKVKKQMELEQEVSQMPDKKTVYTSYGMYGTGYSYETENTAKTKKKKELEDLKVEIKTGYQNAASEEQKGFNILKKAGINGANTYKAGTIGAIEQALSAKQDALKRLSDPSQIKANIKETEKLQKQLDSLTGKKEKPTKEKTKDPFLEKLEKQKAEYTRFMKWINSGDQIIAKAASKEFAGLLKQGSSYIDYLKNQREQILAVDVANRSKAQNKQLRTLNDQIAEETKKTVLEAFNNELADQLTNAKTVMEMLNIIAQKRKALANDNTEVDNGKKDTLDEAEKTALQKQKEETDSLLEEYASYLDKKIKLEMDYNDDITLLEKRRSQATTDADKEKITQAIANRTKQYKKDTKGTGDTDYDAMVQEYANFEQKKQAIIDEFDEKRKSAVEHGNTQLVEELNKAQAKALSSLATNEMKENPNFEKLFGNLDELTTQKLDELLAMFDGKTAFLGVDFDPKDLESIKQKVESIKGEIQQRNPFKALISSFKEYSNATDDESKKKSLTKMFSSASSSIDMVKGTFDSVVSGLDKMGISADEQTSQVLNDIGGMMEGASQLAQGIATGNPLAIIQGSIALISNGYDLIFGGKDRRAEKSIKKHQENIEKLSNAYKQLEWQIDKALGSAVYQNQQAAIANMKQQQVELLGMISDEESKKKTDSGKIKEWQEQVNELDRNIQDAIDEISKDILQTDAKTFADELGDALVEAFGKGEDAADAFSDTVNKVLKEAVLNQLKKRFLETQLQGALDGLEKSMGYWNGDNFIFDGLTDAEIASFKEKVASITGNFNQALGIYSDLFKDISTTESDTSLTGAVKGVSEETASLIGGQMNAMRINQLEATAIMRQQLAALSVIANNTSYNYHLAKLERIVSLLESQSGNSLRSQGLS